MISLILSGHRGLCGCMDLLFITFFNLENYTSSCKLKTPVWACRAALEWLTAQEFSPGHLYMLLTSQLYVSKSKTLKATVSKKNVCRTLL